MSNSKDNRELFNLIEKAVLGDIKATFEIILQFEGLINSEAKINGTFNQDCKEYIEDQLLKYIKTFNKIKKI